MGDLQVHYNNYTENAQRTSNIGRSDVNKARFLSGLTVPWINKVLYKHIVDKGCYQVYQITDRNRL